MFGVRVGLSDVLAHDPEGLEVAGEGGLIHLRDLVADLVAEVDAVEFLVAAVHLGIVDLEVTGTLVRLAAHVSGALNVVLSAQGQHPDARTSDVAGHHGDVGEGHDGLRSVTVLGDAEPMEGHRVVGLAVFDRGGADLFTGHAVDGLELVEVQRTKALFKLFPVLAAFRDEVAVEEVPVEKVVGEHVEEGDIGAGPELEEMARIGNELDLTRIDHDERHALHDALLDARSGDGVSLGRVGPGDEDAIRELEVGDAVGGGAGAEGFLHAPGGGAVADAGAGVDVVRAEADADEFLHQVVLLVGAAGRGDAGDGVSAVL